MLQANARRLHKPVMKKSWRNKGRKNAYWRNSIFWGGQVTEILLVSTGSLIYQN
jgi:hypothetical protein